MKNFTFTFALLAALFVSGVTSVARANSQTCQIKIKYRVTCWGLLPGREAGPTHNLTQDLLVTYEERRAERVGAPATRCGGSVGSFQREVALWMKGDFYGSTDGANYRKMADGREYMLSFFGNNPVTEIPQRVRFYTANSVLKVELQLRGRFTSENKQVKMNQTLDCVSTGQPTSTFP